MIAVGSPEESTRAYYAAHAREFADATAALDMTEIYRPFVDRLSKGAHVLDAGCGSGRDTRAFLQMGFRVTSFDISPELVRLATAHSGHFCHVLAFQDMEFHRKFHGIWACASLLHVSRNEMPKVLEHFARALKPGGVLYVSLKQGDGERVVADGRFFSYFRSQEFQALLTNRGWLQMIDTWLSHAPDSSGIDWPWLNFLAERTRKAVPE